MYPRRYFAAVSALFATKAFLINQRESLKG
jgi:hypothetical protein